MLLNNSYPGGHLQVNVFVKDGPAKGKCYQGQLLTPIKVGEELWIAAEGKPIKLSEVVKATYERDTGSSYVLTRSGNSYIITTFEG
jgi:hypothetical protein